MERAFIFLVRIQAIEKALLPVLSVTRNGHKFGQELIKGSLEILGKMSSIFEKNNNQKIYSDFPGVTILKIIQVPTYITSHVDTAT